MKENFTINPYKRYIQWTKRNETNLVVHEYSEHGRHHADKVKKRDWILECYQGNRDHGNSL